MPGLKFYICTNFNPDYTCGFEIKGEEAKVIEDACQHLIEEHGFMDSPQLKIDISNVLIDIDPT